MGSTVLFPFLSVSCAICCRSGVPLVGLEGGFLPVVPLDFVAAAIDHLAHAPGLDGKTFQLVDPAAPTAGEALEIAAQRERIPWRIPVTPACGDDPRREPRGGAMPDGHG